MSGIVAVEEPNSRIVAVEEPDSRIVSDEADGHPLKCPKDDSVT